GPRLSEASTFIIDQARKHTVEDPLHLVILGSCTNVASAVILDSTIVPRIHVHYLGFWHDPATNAYDKKEFNSGNDTLAVEVLLNTAGLKMDVMTATTSQHLVFTKVEVDRQLDGVGEVGELLLDRWETFDRWWTAEDPEKRQWIMWDVAIIEALIHPEHATLQVMDTPPENTQRPIGIYTGIDVPAMKSSFWAAVGKK
ncbi:MAG: nucleoside hydrolase, partial [Bacteroidota bacterium]